MLRFSSSRDQGLGDALPAGTVRVYQRDARGNPQFVGESAIGHTPMGSELGLVTGQAFDVKVKPVVERRERLGSDRWRTTMRYTLTNARPERGHRRSHAIGPVGRHQDHRGEHAERAPLRRRRAVARARPGQWRGGGHRDLRHALLRRACAPDPRPSLSKAVLFLTGGFDSLPALVARRRPRRPGRRRS